MRELSQFLTEFSAAMDRFGADYIKQHGTEVDGYQLVCALTRWAAATIAAAPEGDRASLLFNTVARLHADLAEIEAMHGNPLVTPKRRLN